VNIDERLDRLTERHGALAQSIELMVADGKLVGARIQVLAEACSKLFETAAKQADATGKRSESIDKLSRIAEIHEHRLDDLEGAT